MKKSLFAVLVVLGLSTSMQAHAASGSGTGCNVWGDVSYLYQSASGTSLAIIDGVGCFVSGTTENDVSVMSSILSQALATNKEALLEINSSGYLAVAIKP